MDSIKYLRKGNQLFKASKILAAQQYKYNIDEFKIIIKYSQMGADGPSVKHFTFDYTSKLRCDEDFKVIKNIIIHNRQYQYSLE